LNEIDGDTMLFVGVHFIFSLCGLILLYLSPWEESEAEAKGRENEKMKCARFEIE